MKEKTMQKTKNTEFFPIERLTDKEIEQMFHFGPNYCLEDKIENDLIKMHAYG